MDRIGARALNRATLARQLLLQRSERDPERAVAHLAGLQSQTTHSWYVGLWSRVAAFDADAVGAALTAHRLVRLPLMRSTIHLVTAADAAALRPVIDVVLDRTTRGQFGRHLRDLDPATLAAVAREIVGTQPLTAAGLGRALAERFPDRDPLALADAARAWLPMLQLPPRGVWGRSGQARLAPLDELVPATPAATVADLLIRYLAAFGPASVRDAQQWCGLTRLAEVADGIRARLITLTDDDGRELLDLPDAPRPPADTPAPVRFLYDFDNLLLSHADRSRMVDPGIVGGYAEQGFGGDNQEQPSTVLVDGTAAATWKAVRVRREAALTVRPFRRLTAAERTAVADEGAALLGFLHPGSTPDVRIV